MSCSCRLSRDIPCFKYFLGIKYAMSSKSRQKKIVGWRFPILLFGFVLVVWLLTWYLLVRDPDRGTFGEMFGSVNALFSGLAFAALIYTIFLQRRELRLHHQEIELTHKEVKAQVEQLQAQNATLNKQNFENTL